MIDKSVPFSFANAEKTPSLIESQKMDHGETVFDGCQTKTQATAQQ
jgi:hypothetical protein